MLGPVTVNSAVGLAIQLQKQQQNDYDTLDEKQKGKRKSNGANSVDANALPTLRPIAFAATAFCTVAITSCLIAFPLILYYIQTLESSVQLDLDVCKSQSREMWREMFELRVNNRQYFAGAREKRDTIADFWRRRLLDMQLRDDPVERYGGNGGGTYGPIVSPDNGYGSQTKKPYYANLRSYGNADRGTDQFVETPSTGCCTCHRGAPGAPGPRGRDGLHGLNGEPGPLGPPGPPAPPGPDPLSLLPSQCPCDAPRGDSGAKGQQGADGGVGPPGESGEDGKPGDQGPRGPVGLPGQPGQPGRPGALGEPGAYHTEIGPQGQPGPPGRPGPPGSTGTNGSPGNDGLPGRPGAAGSPGPPGSPGKSGAPGASGRQGEQGAPGSCDHCPPARLAPGY